MFKQSDPSDCSGGAGLADSCCAGTGSGTSSGAGLTRRALIGRQRGIVVALLAKHASKHALQCRNILIRSSVSH